MMFGVIIIIWENLNIRDCAQFAVWDGLLVICL